MARGRLIVKSLSASRRAAALYTAAPALAEFCQFLFVLLVVHADDFGRLSADPFDVKHVVIPTSPRTEEDIAEALNALAAVELIHLYEVDGRHWLAIEQFDAHQSGLHRRTQSTIPEPPGNFRELPGTSRSFPESSGNSRKFRVNRTE